MFRIGLALLLTIIQAIKCASIQVPTKTYSCQASGACQLNDPSVSSHGGISQSACLATCGTGNLWPYPTGKVSFEKTVSYFDSTKILFMDNNQEETSNLKAAMYNNFFEVVSTLKKPQPLRPHFYQQEDHSKDVKLIIQSKIKDFSITQPSPQNDESYQLNIKNSNNNNNNEVQIMITANTIFGFRHGLETLSQFIFWDDLHQSLGIVNTVSVEDRPAFSYRGSMIDVSRNFISLNKLKESIRALGYNKMNVLHLHLSDTASFPLTIPSQPNLTAYGAYDNERMFSTADIEGLVQLAASYGVMLLPEIDTPAHVSAGWQWGKEAGLGNLIVCDDPYGQKHQSWTTDALEPPSGQLNLGNENVYKVLKDVYGDVLSQIPSPYFHLGGDEVIVGSDESWAACYNSSTLGKEVIDYIENLGLSRQDSASFYGLWENFTIRATEMIQSLYVEKNLTFTKLHIWGGGGVDNSGVCYNLLAQPNVKDYLPPKLFTIQVWDDSSDSIVPELIKQGYSVILSNTDYVYLDCGNAGQTNPGGYWCQPYHEWFHIYQYIADIQAKWSLTDEEVSAFIVGSETLIWTEMVDDQNLSQKLWPRTAALAEALWSNPKTGWYAANARFQQWRNRLVERGVAAEALQARWCQQRDGWACSVNTGVPQ